MKSILDKNFIISFLLFFLIASSLIILSNNKKEDIPTQNNLSVINSSQLAASAAYVPLADGFYVSHPEGGTDSAQIFNVIYQWMIGIAIASAVVMIILGGAQYMTIDSIHGKSEGLSKVRGAIAGLLLAVSSYIILNTINPQIIGGEGGTEMPDAERADEVELHRDFLGNNFGYSGSQPAVYGPRMTNVPSQSNPNDRNTNNYSIPEEEGMSDLDSLEIEINPEDVQVFDDN